MTGRTLVAGVGNIFQRDDAFGVEVIRLLAGRPRPAGVKVADFGIRGVHLVYELLDGCDLFVLVDAAQRGCAPGTCRSRAGSRSSARGRRSSFTTRACPQSSPAHLVY